MHADKPKKMGPWLVIAALAVVIIGVVAALQYYVKPVAVNNFEQCRAATGEVMESYPEQCYYKDRTYVNQKQRPPKEMGYVGMSEDEALLIADENNVPARVVERDGESLPATMDFMPGRNNLYVRDNVVYKVTIEGAETVE